MNEIITKLNEIEEKAESIISDAQSRKEQLGKQLEADRKEIDRKYDRMEQEMLEQLEQKLNREAEAKIKELREMSQAAMDELNASFLLNRDKMAEEIVKRIIQPGL